MSIEIIENRIQSYSPQTLKQEEQVLKEIYQEIALAGLSRQGFFKHAGFQGGTCLRIIHQLNRFSEDLDFILMRPNDTFNWESYLNGVKQEFSIYGIDIEISPPKNKNSIHKTFLKDDSFKRIFKLSTERNRSHKQKILIKFEIDVNPPKGSQFETHYLDFPLPFSVVTQDKPSLFGSKCHALLCRPYLKGRDWYDFLWYIGNRIPVNYEHLKYSLIQSRDWEEDPKHPLTKQMLLKMLRNKIKTIDWEKASNDVAPLLKPIDRDMLSEWNEKLFLFYLDKLDEYLRGEKKKGVLFRISFGPAPSIVDDLFSGAVADFDDEEIEKINSSGTFWCQSLESIQSLDDEKKYKVVFLHLDQQNTSKKMGGKTSFGEMKMSTYIPGQTYLLPGWFIKNWNSRKLIHTQGIYRTLYWFQPLEMTPLKKIEQMKLWAKKHYQDSL